MAFYSAKTRRLSTNSLLPTFFLAIVGWGLLHAWGVRMNAGMTMHILFAIPCLVLSGLTIYRYKHHWPNKTAAYTGQKKLRKNYRAIAAFLVSAAAGFGLALLINHSFFFLTLTSLGLVCVPWTRFSACRNHFFAMSLLTAIWAGVGMLMTGGPDHPLSYPAAAALLLVISSSTLLFTIVVNGNRLDRMPSSGFSQEPMASVFRR